MAGMLTRSNVILWPQLFTTSPSPAGKSFYSPARVCFRWNTNTLLSSFGVNRGLVLSVLPRKSNNLSYYYNAPDSDSYLQLLKKKINKPFVVNNNKQSIINSTCDNNSNSSIPSVTHKLVEFKKTVVKTIFSLLLFGFLAFMTAPTFRTSAVAASLSSSSSLPSLSSSSTPNPDCKEECVTSDNISKPTSDLYEELWINIITIILFIKLAPLIVPMFLVIIPGYKYYIALCKHTKEKSVLMLQFWTGHGNRKEKLKELLKLQVHPT